MNNAFATDIINAVVDFGVVLSHGGDETIHRRFIAAAYDLNIIEGVTLDENYNGVMHANLENQISVTVDLGDGNTATVVFYGSLSALLLKMSKDTKVTYDNGWM